jgi:7-cyano-7-deazaguanine reductase
MTRPEDSALGRPTEYAAHYDPRRLFPIPRAAGRAALGLDAAALPFRGVDVWNAYELSWLDPRGKPQVALAELRVPATSTNLIESKSLKLYLNGFMQTRMRDADEVLDCIARDLGAAAGAAVEVLLLPLSAAPTPALLDGDCIDELPISIERYQTPDPALLGAGGDMVSEALVSHLLKSNCPVTGQPDWASLQIRYSGPRIDREGLLRYLIAFREHGDFHEACVERIWCDLWRRLSPQRLSVYARYTRRGGIDINPFRSSEAGERPENPRLARQ